MKQMLAKHWEKLALGLSVALVAAYFIVGVGMAKKNLLIPDARKNTGLLENELNTKGLDLAPLDATSAKVVKSFGTAVAAAPGEANVYNRPPEIAVKTETAAAVAVRAPDPKTLPVFKKPVLGTPVVEPGSVKLAWSDSPETKNVKVAGYVVYRKSPDGKDFEKLTAAAITDLTYTDSKVEAKKQYQYAVGAVVTDKDVLAKLSPAVPGGELQSDPQSVTTVGVLDMELKGVAEIPLEPDQPPVPTAQLMIKKFIDGRWRSKLYLVRKGDKMGDGDLATGCVVEALARVSVQRTEEYTVNKYDDKTGMKIGEEKKQRTREVQAWELKYLDEAGKPQKMYPVERAAAPVPPPPAEKAPAAPGATPPPAPKPPAPGAAVTPAPK